MVLESLWLVVRRVRRGLPSSWRESAVLRSWLSMVICLGTKLTAAIGRVVARQKNFWNSCGRGLDSANRNVYSCSNWWNGCARLLAGEARRQLFDIRVVLRPGFQALLGNARSEGLLPNREAELGNEGKGRESRVTQNPSTEEGGWCKTPQECFRK